MTILETGSYTLGLAVMIVGAIVWRSVWALVVGGLVTAAVKAVASHLLLAGPANRLAWEAAAKRELIRFGKWIFVSTAVTFVAIQADRAVLGKLVSLDRLGVYSIALMFAMVPVQIVATLAGRVQFPLFSRAARSDRHTLASKVLQSRRMLLSAGLVANLGVALCAPAFFGYLYDYRYGAAAWMAQLLSIVTWITMLQYSVDRALLSLGDSRSMAVMNVCRAVVAVGGSIGGFFVAGLPGFVTGLMAGAMTGHVVTQVVLNRHGIDIIRQDLRFSALYVGLVVVGAAGPAMVNARFDLTTARAMSLIGAAVLSVVAVVVVRQILGELKRK